MWMTILRGLIAGLVVMGVTEVSKKYPRYGALLLSLPLVSILAFLFAWTKHRDLATISNLARETLILVPLGLPFFVPMVLANRFSLTFWPAFLYGILLASASIGCWLYFGPKAS